MGVKTQSETDVQYRQSVQKPIGSIDAVDYLTFQSAVYNDPSLTCGTDYVCGVEVKILDLAISDYDPDSSAEETRTEDVLEYIILEQVFYREYQQVVSYLQTLFEKSLPLLQKLGPEDSMAVDVPKSEDLPSGLTPKLLELLVSLGYHYEAVDRIETMDQVTVMVNGSMSSQRLVEMTQLIRSLSDLSLVYVRYILNLNHDKAETILELIQAADSESIEQDSYQANLRHLSAVGEDDILLSLGFVQKRKLFRKSVYEHITSSEISKKSTAFVRILKFFHSLDD